ncbi:MAG: hypothetical protein EYC70_11565 [Planctomycetota bacterium]|nr:MAG: hypothetical protein EYC70_11565 [Planctomycetota bacterium]
MLSTVLGWLFRPIRAGRLFGIPLLVMPSVLLLTGFILVWAGQRGGAHGFAALALLFAILAVSLLAHELGHALAARRLGLRVHGITISPLISAALLEGMAGRPRAEALVALAGPAVNLALAGVCALLPWPWARSALWINLVLGLGNLVPAFPTDGGRVVRAWFARRSPLPDATRAAIVIANVFLVGLLAYAWQVDAFALGLVLAAYLFFAARRELAQDFLRTWRLPSLAFAAVVRRSFQRAAPAPADAPGPPAAEPGKPPRAPQELERFRGSMDEFFGRRPDTPAPEPPASRDPS